MRAIDRVRTIQSIVAEITHTMGFEDVHVFFKEMNLALSGDRYGGALADIIRSYLDSCSNTLLLEVASQLDLELTITPSLSAQLGDSRYWLDDHFRVFISHVHTSKKSAAYLKDSLHRYGISSFVAHEDIEVSEDWRDEILRSLLSMDALVAVLTPDFSSSKWTDQEVGAAICRGVLIVPINKGVQPYGFLEKYQSHNSSQKSVGDIAVKVFEAISSSSKTKEPMAHCLSKLISRGADIETATFRMRLLGGIDGIGDNHWMAIRNNIAAHPTLSRSEPLVSEFNNLLEGRNIETVPLGGEKAELDLEDEIPF